MTMMGNHLKKTVTIKMLQAWGVRHVNLGLSRASSLLCCYNHQDSGAIILGIALLMDGAETTEDDRRLLQISR